MPLIIIIILLSLLKYFEVGPFTEMSWWWVLGLLGFAFLWFEFLERIFGLDKREDAHEQLKKAREERVKNAFKPKTRSKRR